MKCDDSQCGDDGRSTGRCGNDTKGIKNVDSKIPARTLKKNAVMADQCFTTRVLRPRSVVSCNVEKSMSNKRKSFTNPTSGPFTSIVLGLTKRNETKQQSKRDETVLVKRVADVLFRQKDILKTSAETVCNDHEQEKQFRIPSCDLAEEDLFSNRFVAGADAALSEVEKSNKGLGSRARALNETSSVNMVAEKQIRCIPDNYKVLKDGSVFGGDKCKKKIVLRNRMTKDNKENRSAIKPKIAETKVNAKKLRMTKHAEKCVGPNVSSRRNSIEPYLIGKGSLRRKTGIIVRSTESLEPAISNLSCMPKRVTTSKLTNDKRAKGGLDIQGPLMLSSTPLKSHSIDDLEKDALKVKQLRIPLSPIPFARSCSVSMDGSFRCTRQAELKGNEVLHCAENVPKKPTKFNNRFKKCAETNNSGRNKRGHQMKESNMRVNETISEQQQKASLANHVCYVDSSNNSSGDVSSKYNPYDLFVLDEPINFAEEMPKPTKSKMNAVQLKLDGTFIVRRKDSQPSQKKQVFRNAVVKSDSDSKMEKERMERWLKEAEKFNLELSKIEEMEFCIE